MRLNILLQSFDDDQDQDQNCTFCPINTNSSLIDDEYSEIYSDHDRSANNDRDFVLLFNFWMLGVIMPLIAVFGILANAASIVVLTRKIMRSSTINIYLAGLSAFDGLLLLMSLLLYPSLSFCELQDTDPSSPWCRYFFYSALFTYPLSLIMQSCSVWTLTAITVDRFVAISWPLRSRDWCTSRRAYIALAAIVFWSIFYNLPVFFELKLKIIETRLVAESNDQQQIENLEYDLNNNFFNTTTMTNFVSNYNDIESTTTNTWAKVDRQIVLDQTDLRKQSIYKLAYKGYCYLFFMLLIPAGAMIVLNLFVTVSVRRAYRLRRAMSGREEKERRCTIMAVLVVLTFLVLNSLAFANNMIEIFASTTSSSGEETSIKSSTYLISVSIGNVLIALNSATNFVIYCALGLRFRTMFCKIFCIGRFCRSSTNFASSRFGPTASATGGGGVTIEKNYQSVAVRYSVRGVDRQHRINNNCSNKSISQQNGHNNSNNNNSRGSRSNSKKISGNTLTLNHTWQLGSSFDDLTTNVSSNGYRKSFDDSTSGLSHRYV